MALSDRIPYQAQVDRPKLTLPGGKKLAVWVILNVEEWRIENAMPRTVLSPPMGQPLLPDVPNWSWHEYGMRAGFWRQFKALTDRKMPVTLALNANVCNSYPRVASAALEAGFEFMGHGFVQGPMHKVENQADAIKRSVETIAKFAGKPPRSWESPGLTETEETLDLLRLNGIEYVADWVIDDLPQDIATPHGTITTIPYSVETNDIVIHALQHLPSEQFLKRCTDQFDRLYLEGASNARIMAISIHPYITGVPHRIKYLEALLDYVIGHDGVALMTASEIGDWYRAEMATASVRGQSHDQGRDHRSWLVGTDDPQNPVEQHDHQASAGRRSARIGAGGCAAFGVKTAPRFEDALADAEIEAVILCTPQQHHAEADRGSGRSGRHVFCEKPLCTTAADAEAAVAAVRRAGVQLGIGHERRFEPAVIDMRKRFAAGEFGTSAAAGRQFQPG